MYDWENILILTSTLLLAGLFILLLANPAEINVTSVINKDISVELTNSKFAIFLNSKDLEERTRFENLFAEKLRENNINAFPISEILPPYKNYTEKEIAQALRKHGINYIIFVDILFKETKEKYIPPSYDINTHANTYGYYSTFTNSYTGFTTYTTTINRYGGYTVDIPFAGYEFTILDVDFNNIYWRAQAKTTISTIFASFKRLEEIIIEKVTKTMLTELKK